MANSGRLYVFLHGLTVIKDRGNELEVVLPLVPGHVYKAGNWLGETPIRRDGLLRLQGVTANPKGAPFSQWGSAIQLPGTTLTSRKRGATLVLPRPSEVLPLIHGTHPVFAAQTIATSVNFKDVATVHVLVYDYPDENEVFLDGHYWEPCPTGGSTTLQLLSTSEQPESKEHENETEDVLHEVLRNYPGLRFQESPRPLLPPFMHVQDPNYGLTGQYSPQGEYVLNGGRLAFAQAELEPPPTRAARIARLGRSKRGDRPIEGLWHLPDALTLEVSDCVTI